MQLLQPFPIRFGIRIVGRINSVAPRDICDGPLGDHAHILLDRFGQRQIRALLIGDIDARLQRIERAGLHGV